MRAASSVLFEGERPFDCEDAADADDDGEHSVGDAITVLLFLFAGGEVLPAPGLTCGLDPTPDELACGSASGGCGARPAGASCEICPAICDLDLPQVALTGCREGSCVILACDDQFFDIDEVFENGCEARIIPNGTPCDDRDPCTENDAYFQGVCGGFEIDCSALDSDCEIGVCDGEGECITFPRERGVICDDGDRFTRGDQCNGQGECVGIPIPVNQ